MTFGGRHCRSHFAFLSETVERGDNAGAESDENEVRRAWSNLYAWADFDDEERAKYVKTTISEWRTRSA